MGLRPQHSVGFISVIVPTYDDSQYLEQAIDSILSQSADVEIEIIVVDSSSTSDVKSIVNDYGSEVKYEWIKPNGVAVARNYGIEKASGDVIGFCDADDYWHPEKLEQQLPKLRDGCDIVYSDEYLLDDGHLLPITSPPIKNADRHHVDYFRQGGVGSRTVLVRQHCLQDEQFDENFIVREDPHLWTRLFKKYEPGRVAEPLSYKRRRDDSLTSDRDVAFEMQLKEIEELVDRFPELERYREEREVKARLQYAKTLIRDENRVHDARKILFDLLYRGHVSTRLGILLIFSLVPICAQKLLRAAQRLQHQYTGREPKDNEMIRSVVFSLKNRIYQGRVKTASKWLGIESVLRPVYSRVIVQLSEESVPYTVDGVSANFHAEDLSELNRHSTKIKEHPILEDIIRSLRSEDTFVDIGSNLGTYTCLAAEVIESGEVVAFEPVPEMAGRVRDNLRLNDQQATVLEIAVSDSDGKQELLIEGGANSASLVSPEEGESIRVRSASIDTLISEGKIPSPDVLQIDAEGAEGAVIRGIEETLEKEPPRLIYCEIHPNRLDEAGDSVDQIKNLLQEAGYNIERINIDDREQYFLKAVR